MIRARKECQEIPWGAFEILSAPSGVLALRYDWRNTSLVTLHNFNRSKVRLALDVKAPGGGTLVDVFDASGSHADPSGHHRLTLEPYGYRWFRVGSPDNALARIER